MKQNDPVKNVMSKDIVTANKSMKLSELRKMFIENHFHHLPVVNGSELIGMLSYTDILRIDSGELYKQAPEQSDALLDSLSSLEEVMTTDVVTIESNDPVRKAVEILSHGDFHSLPVIGEDGLEGIITSTDLFKYFLAQY